MHQSHQRLSGFILHYQCFNHAALINLQSANRGFGSAPVPIGARKQCKINIFLLRITMAGVLGQVSLLIVNYNNH